MKLFTKLFLVAFMATSFVASAQDEESSKPELSISGSVDAYYRANLDGDNLPGIAPGSSFANKPGFALGMANVVLGVEGENSGFVADLVFGPRGDEAVFGSVDPSGDPSNSAIVNQLYAYWNVGESTTLTMGNFNTFLGYEVISPSANFNYSTSYMFSNGPFSHTGLKADFSLSDDLSAMVAVMNPTDDTDFNHSDEYAFGAQLGYKGVYLNYITSDDFYQIDLTAGFDVTETLYVGVNATKAKDAFDGAALYLQNSFSDEFALGLRAEKFNWDGGTDVLDLTLSANYKVGALTIIPEFRVDTFGDSVLTTEGTFDPSTGVLTATKVSDKLSSFLLAAVYTF